YQKSPIYRLNGTVEGLGHTISNLTIDVSSDYYGDNIGLIDQMNSGATVRDLGLPSVNIRHNVGGITVYIGALVGYQDENTAITNSYATGLISFSDFAVVGGLV